MRDYDEYDDDYSDDYSDAPRRRNNDIDFSNREFDEAPRRNYPNGLHDEDWHDARGDYQRAPKRRERKADNSRRNQYSDEPSDVPRNDYRTGYRDAVRDYHNDSRDNYRDDPRNDYRNDSHMSPSHESFIRRHPVLMNLIYACAAGIMVIFLLLWFLDFWTFHGQERAVPNVKGQSYEMAMGNINRAGLRGIVTDSIYDNYARPGTVVDQSPIPSARIKKGGAVYLTLVAYTPKMVTIPDFYDVSERQARSMLEGLGITQVLSVKVPSEYTGLVLGARFNGVSLRPGARVPVTAVITLEVGGGYDDTVADTTDVSIVDSQAIDEAIEVLNID